MTEPAEADVRLGVQYGAGGTEFTGLLVPGSCDYPAVGKVAFGISYDFGALVGTRTEPIPAQVLLGIQYGASGTEFTGTLQSYNPPPPVPPCPPINPVAQSCTIPQLLDALKNRIGLYVGMPDRVIEWDSALEEFPAVQGRDFQAIRIVRLDPQPMDGAGRWGWRCKAQVSVGIWTRNDTDETGTIKAWNRIHWPNVFLALNGLAGRHLFAAYSTSGNNDPTGLALSGPLVLMSGQDLNKATFRTGFGYTELQFSTLVVLALDPRHLDNYITP
jgi:hypothetical protein